MGIFSPPGARLNALIGDAVLELPSHIVERLEQKLAELGMEDPTPALVAHLTLMHHDAGADSLPWQEAGLWPGHPDDLATLGHSVQGLDALLQILHAAHLTRRHAGPEQQLGDHLEGLLFLAASELVEDAMGALHGRR
ncbi:hypothetical protein [Stenotrophomonas tumulicola]|uniref:Uncharacterized protein n=1 Tax=Stenotrophomonas tumulicola TaxID=1685415 RepID=A0A7W3IJU4_9GAMM|nr:hypothetical protein [Stenotrophomonas tumulicola]MBA8683661.1 hypothetical protein [Stenotrophomonas tumulicola]